MAANGLNSGHRALQVWTICRSSRWLGWEGEMSPTTNSRSGWVAFLGSWLVHVGLLLILACAGAVGGLDQESVVDLMVDMESSTGHEETLEIGQFAIVSEAPASAILEAPSPATSFDTVQPLALPSLDDSLPSLPVGTSSHAASQVAQAGGARGATGSGGIEGAGAGASFFGVSALGSRFVFVVDSSTSMRGMRWESAVEELQRSIESLSPDQRFAVICFDHDTYPFQNRSGAHDGYFMASRKSQLKLRAWLRHHELGYETFPGVALRIALGMNPDAIFLLSDGQIHDPSLEWLRQWNLGSDGLPRIPIYTISLHSTQGAQTLRQIAQEHGGQFRAVGGWAASEAVFSEPKNP
jgi:hypothetical protein